MKKGLVGLLPTTLLFRKKNTYLSFHHNKLSWFKVTPVHFCPVEYIINCASLRDQRLPVATLNVVSKNDRKHKIECQHEKSPSSYKLRACLHGGGGPQLGEVTRLDGVTCLSI